MTPFARLHNFLYSSSICYSTSIVSLSKVNSAFEIGMLQSQDMLRKIIPTVKTTALLSEKQHLL